MNIFNTKVIILFLFSFFVIVNIVFSLYYYYNNETDGREKKNNEMIGDIREEVKILQKIVDFNNTTYENNGVVHFYNAANQKVSFRKIQNQIESIEQKNIENTNIQTNKPFYDEENGIYIDSDLNFCRREYFDYKKIKCLDKKIKFKDKIFPNNPTVTSVDYEYIDHNCDEKIKCCMKEYECLNKCIETNKMYDFDYFPDEIILKKCEKICEIKIYTKNYFQPFCYLSPDKMTLENMNITVALSMR